MSRYIDCKSKVVSNMSVFWSSLLWFLAGGIVGAAISFYFTKRSFEKQLRDNPPINEKMIRAMYMQMGRKPTEAQINQVMRAMNAADGPSRKSKSKK